MMILTNREEQLLEEIHKWEESLQSVKATDMELLYEEWLEKGINLIPSSVRETYLHKIDEGLFQLTALIQGTEMQTQATKRIIETARVFKEDITDLSEMNSLQVDQLSYICEQQMAKLRLYALSQGALSGTGQSLLVGIDIPVVLCMNIQAVQQAAMSYGYHIQTPSELMLTLKVFHAATLPKHLQAEGWHHLKSELSQEFDPYFYEGVDQIVDKTWLQKIVVQIGKTLAIFAAKRKVYNRLPVVSMMVGGGMNYRMAKQVTDYAKRFYQYRYLLDKKNESH